jgi:GNAT superfamily N-acetyltransferase
MEPMPVMRVAPMALGELERALDWAAEEGWNPGLDDAAAFLAADRGGFLMGWIGDEPVAAISAVRHSASFGFLGLFLCRPEWRGQGFGRQIWQAGLALLGDRSIGLDAVAAQEANYARGGFLLSHRTVRYRGRVEPEPWSRLVPFAPRHLPALLALDRRASGVARDAYLGAWFAGAPTRRTLVIEADGEVAGFGTIRACREGAKVGPLHAADPADAERLLRALATLAPPEADIALDVPEPNYAGGALARDLGLEAGFGTARMYRGTAPAEDHAPVFGAVTLELG